MCYLYYGITFIKAMTTKRLVCSELYLAAAVREDVHMQHIYAGTQKYTDALRLLFDPKNSKAELISLKVRS